MKSFVIIIAYLFFLQTGLSAQNIYIKVKSPEINDFQGALKFLSSGWMEGRETGEKGSFMAADYVASMMQFCNLVPYNKTDVLNQTNNKQFDYFQDFELIRYSIEKSNLSLIKKTAGSQSLVNFSRGIDYHVNAVPHGREAEAPVVFAGYGISSAENGYDDYKGIDVKNKIVLILRGFPGCIDTNSFAYKKFVTLYTDDEVTMEIKENAARQHGAIAIVVINTEDDSVFSHGNSDIIASEMNLKPNKEPVYEDADYILPADIMDAQIPLFLVNKSAGMEVLSGTGIKVHDFEVKATQLITSSLLIKDKSIGFSIAVKKKSLPVRNVIGLIEGKDRNKNIILGAHYDHLGKRNEDIYYGADDNASGTAGLLALAKVWTGSGIQPACNLIFASWTAEEKGLLGSRFFAQTLNIDKKNILLYLNMDMISGSEKSDTARRQLSIGTMKVDKHLRELAILENSNLNRQFILDLWDVTGHTGSDYASFTEMNVPVMTFNSGLHDYYHTPGDKALKTDEEKMKNILKLINNCLKKMMDKIP